MGIAHLPQWDVTAVEIAVDLEISRSSAPSLFFFSGAAEPRICLVAGFALTPQLRHLVAAIDRVVPVRLPGGLHVAPPSSRTGRAFAPAPVTIQPMVSLLRLQRKLVRAIEPGLAKHAADAPLPGPSGMDPTTAEYVRNFIPGHNLPTFEPQHSPGDFAAARFKAVGITIYRLGTKGVPESILGHWAYAPSSRGSLHLRSGA